MTKLARSLALGLSLSLAAPALAALPAGAASTQAPPAFTPPAYIQGVTSSGDTPAAIWYFPKNVATVTHEVFTWLRQATPAAAPAFPKEPRGLVHDYMGPAQLWFTGPSGTRIAVYPAFYLAGGPGRLVRVHYAPDTLAYVVNRGAGARTTSYLRAPALYRFLRDDASWHAQFQMEAFTQAEGDAVEAVLASSVGKALHGFPRQPGTAAVDIQAGSRTVHASATADATQEGPSIRVQFAETWNNGRLEHVWRFRVSAKGWVTRVASMGAAIPAGTSSAAG